MFVICGWSTYKEALRKRTMGKSKLARAGSEDCWRYLKARCKVSLIFHLIALINMFVLSTTRPRTLMCSRSCAGTTTSGSEGLKDRTIRPPS